MTAPDQRIAYLGPLYQPGHVPGALRINPAWAYVPPVRQGFRLYLDREESTVYRGIAPADADRRRREQFPMQGSNRYPSRLIETALTARIAADLGVAAENLLIGNGIMSMLTYLYDIYSKPLGNVCVPTPGFWPAYTYAMQRARGIRMPLFDHDRRDPLHPRFDFPLEATRDALKQGADLCYLSNPNNPTGNLLAFDAIGELIAEFPQTLFVVDEAYGAFAANSKDGERFQLDDALRLIRQGCGNLVVARTFSKAYAMANFRVGYLVSHPANIMTVRSHMGSCDVDELSIAIAYYNYTEDGYMREIVRSVVRNKQVYEALLERHGIAHYGGYRNSILVAALDLGKAYEARGIAVRAMVYQKEIPNPVADCFRIAIPADDDNMALLLDATQDALGGAAAIGR